jgi:hypothetical protein
MIINIILYLFNCDSFLHIVAPEIHFQITNPLNILHVVNMKNSGKRATEFGRRTYALSGAALKGYYIL